MPNRSALRDIPRTGERTCSEAPAIQERERWRATGSVDADTALLDPMPARVQAQDIGSGIADGDWDDLFIAVQEQLAHAVSGGLAGPTSASELCPVQIRECVLDCVAALRLLQDTVTTERLRRDGLELAVFEAQTSLAQVRAALVGTQQGERRARYDALHDSLTQLPNREFLQNAINHQLARVAQARRMFAVMFLDLDGFKLVNDAHGHAAGDELLRIIAARLRRIVRARDVVGRVGGDEFACMIGGVEDAEQLVHLADKIGLAISAPCTVGGLELVVHASIGIATFPDAGSSAEELLKSADQAMYAAKRNGDRHAFFSRGDAAATAAQPDPE